MKLFSFLFPKVLYRTSSQYNKEIKVISVDGKNQLLVNGIQQTGPYDESIFTEALSIFGVTDRPNISSILLLGLGGGFVAKKLHQHYPSAAIICVDIDPTMETIAKKYFGLQDIPQIHYVVADAQKFVQTVTKDTYDVIVIDLFIGDDIPQFVDSHEFLNSIRNMIRKDGLLLINYQSYKKYAVRRAKLNKFLSLLFPSVIIQNIRNNCFFCAVA
jgi:spermidine synthase